MRGLRSLKRKKLFLITLGILLLIWAVVFFGYKLFTENRLTKFQIETENLNCTTTEEITGFLQSLNLKYFNFKKEPLEQKLSQKFFCIGKIEQEVSYPDRLKLRIAGREGKFVVNTIQATLETNPSIVLSLDQLNATQSTTEAFPPKILNQILKTYQNSSPSTMFLVDEEGVAFQEASTDVGFPKLSIFGVDLKTGQKIPDDLIKKAIEINSKLKDLSDFSGNFIVVGDKLITDSKPRITFSLSRPLDRQAASLQLILRQAKMNLVAGNGDSRSVESIDLRFDRPVVVYSEK
jgi:hypothetical protein